MALRPGMTATRAGNRAHRPRDVIGERDDARRAGAGRRFEFVTGDDGPVAHAHDVAANAEVAQHAPERFGVPRENLLAGAGLRAAFAFGEEVERRQPEFGFAARGLAGGRGGRLAGRRVVFGGRVRLRFRSLRFGSVRGVHDRGGLHDRAAGGRRGSLFGPRDFDCRNLGLRRDRWIGALPPGAPVKPRCGAARRRGHGGADPAPLAARQRAGEGGGGDPCREHGKRGENEWQPGPVRESGERRGEQAADEAAGAAVNGPLGGREGERERRRKGEKRRRQGGQAKPWVSEAGVAPQPPAPCEDDGGQHGGRRPETLQREIGPPGAASSEPVGGAAAARRVP